MGKKLGGSTGSWLTAVKRAFRSPSKEDHIDKKNTRRRVEVEPDQEEEERKKKEKGRWLFRRGQNNIIHKKIQISEPVPTTKSTSRNTNNNVGGGCNSSSSDQQRHAIAAAATTAAEAAVATAKAAAEIIRLSSIKTQPLLISQPTNSSVLLKEQQYAAILIQTAFRGYLARRALQALKGIVKLQAVVRGHNVRKQTKMTLNYMQALLRVQSRIQARPSHEAATRKSMFAESTTNLWDSRYMQDVRSRKSTHSRAGSWIPEDWEECPRTLHELDALLQARKKSALCRERSLAHAFSQQKLWDYENDGNEEELEEGGGKWLDGWMETKKWENKGRYSYDKKETLKKVVDLDSSKPYSYSSPIISSRSQPPQTTPHRRGLSPQAPATPSPAKMRPLHLRSSSPRTQREARRSYSTANTPSLASARCSSGVLTPQWMNESHANSQTMPNYMAATESAKARVRSQSVTRQRPCTPERERGGGSVKKRLSYPVNDIYYSDYGSGCDSFGQKLRSPSFKSVQAGFVGMEQRSNLSSCCAESIIGEISPCSTTDLRRWLR